jgi:hypothetical protein
MKKYVKHSLSLKFQGNRLLTGLPSLIPINELCTIRFILNVLLENIPSFSILVNIVKILIMQDITM